MSLAAPAALSTATADAHVKPRAASKSKAIKSKAIQPGSSGPAVRTLQRKLRVRADGSWGPATTRALRRYQRRNGLSVTGRLDTQTRQRLGYPTEGSKVRAPRGLTLSPEVIERVQTVLGATADGEWGPQSTAALKKYEAEKGLPVDGAIDPEVLTAMGIDPNAPADPAAAATVPTDSANPKAQQLVAAAREQIGVPYSYGGTTPKGFDCSGLTGYVFKQAGIRLPRTSFDQYKRGTAVPKQQIQAGDLVFFNAAGPGASHSAVAISPTKVISATTRGVMEHKIFDSYWGARYVGTRRVTG